MPESYTYDIAISIVPHWECQTSAGVGAREWTGYGEAPAMCVGPVSPSLNFCNFSFKRKVNETRMYDPVMSVFLSVDNYVQSPDNSQNFNRYAYCLNNPLRYVDPTGWFYQGGHMGTPMQGPYECQWNSPLEPRDLGLRQLPDCPNPDILWMEANDQKGGCSGPGGISIVGSDGKKTAYTIGMVYGGNDSFTSITVNYLNQIAEISTTAYRMLSELIESGFSYQIVESDEKKHYSPANQEMYAVYEEDEQTAFYVAGGGTVFFNPQGCEVFEKAVDRTTSELKKRPEMGLMHELAHAWDNKAGLLAHESEKFRDLKISEWMAIRTENAIRGEMGISLRTYYGIRNNLDGSRCQPLDPKLYNRKWEYQFTKYIH